MAEESRERSRLGGVFPAVVTPAVGLPDAVQDAQLKPNFRSTAYWFSLRAKSLLQSCPTLRDPVDCSSPGSSVRGILQVRILDWAATPSSRSSLPRMELASLLSPALAGWVLYCKGHLGSRWFSRSMPQIVQGQTYAKVFAKSGNPIRAGPEKDSLISEK